MRKPAAALLVSLALAVPAAAQVPSGRWLTIETEHFRLHHRPEFGPFTGRLASRVESIHERVTAIVGYLPPRKLDVIVADPVADSNGMALPFLDRPYFIVFSTPPEPESAIGANRGWSEIVATHEDAHVVHLMRPQRHGSRLLAIVLPVGPVLLNAPRWVIEGYATLVEGALTGSGRPHSAYRAMLLRQRAIEGALPAYGALSATGGWQGGAMAYLVGSAYLEWLEARQGEGSLVKLWRRMAGRDKPGFSRAFKGVFGERPDVLYGRFVAELTGKAMAAEAALEAAGVVEGETWQRLSWGTLAPAVSPDGRLLAVVRRTERQRGTIAIWTLEPDGAERRASSRAEERERRRLEDPEEVADLPDMPRPRSPRWKLPPVDGFAPSSPRFLKDGKSLVFVRRARDGEGTLHTDLWIWEPESGRTRRVTRLADLREPDPAPSGGWAVAVRSRYGATGLARVDLGTGEVRELVPLSLDDVWSAPRLSPDGSRLVAVRQLGGRWRLVTLLVADPAASREIDLGGASPVGAPAFTPDGRAVLVATDRGGVWNLEEHRLDEPESWRRLTRVKGGALSPAPLPSGDALLFLNVTARGVDLNRLALPGASAVATPLLAEPPVAPPPPAAFPLPEERAVPSARPYRVGDSLRLRPASGTVIAPSGASWQVGVSGDDLLGRLSLQALGGLADGSGPRGGTLAAAWRGFPVVLGGQLFAVEERPSRQRIVQSEGLDRLRWGVALDARWRLFSDAARLEAGAGALYARVKPDGAPAFGRALAHASLGTALERSRGRWGWGLMARATASAGQTDGNGWSTLLGALELSGRTPFGTLAVGAGAGAAGGSPAAEDVFRVGSIASALTPPSLDLARIEAAALPEAYQTGSRVSRTRAELRPAGAPFLRLYGEAIHAWGSPGSLSPPVRLLGAELQLSGRDLPLELGGDLTLVVGAAKIHGDGPGAGGICGYGALVVRP